jgi:PAS domain S-box-containing protein
MINDAIFLIDDTGFIECNREAEIMFGGIREALLHKMPYEISPPTQPDGLDSKVKAMDFIKAAWAGTSQLFEWTHRKFDGTLFDTEVILNRAEVSGRSIVLCIIHDITERKKSDEMRLETEQMFRAIVENSHAGIFIVDDTFHITYANDMVSRMMLRPNEEIIGHDFREFLDEESTKIVVDRYMRRRMGEELPSRYEFNVVQKNGNKRRVEISSTIFRTTSGMLRTVGQVLDITERKIAEEELRKAHEELESRVEQRTSELRETNRLLQNEIARRGQVEEALRRSEVKYRHLIESANTIILEMDTKGRITFFNQFAQDFFGFQEAEILGKNVIGTIVPPRDSSDQDLELMMADMLSHPEHYLHNENENVKRNGERVWIVWTNQPLLDEQGKMREILCVGIDRTEQKKTEQQRALQVREQATTDERNRLARDLHDAVSQTLFSASLISEVLPRLWERDEAEGKKRLEEVRQLTRGALAEMRTLLLELRPTALIEAEIGYLLSQLGESITGRSRVPVTVAVTGKCNMPTEVKVAFYRIAQEALNNVAKHSEASQARVNLLCREKKVSLLVEDNGKGFKADGILSNSLGLDIMKERARSIGATLTIKSRPGKGTRVKVVWNLSAAEVKV